MDPEKELNNSLDAQGGVTGRYRGRTGLLLKKRGGSDVRFLLPVLRKSA
jgi:hypothetical protein